MRSYTLTNVNTGKLLTRNERHLRKLVDQQGVPGGERGTTPQDIPKSDYESDEDSVSSVRSVYTTGRDTGRSATHKLHRKMSHTLDTNTLDTQSNNTYKTGAPVRYNKYKQGSVSVPRYRLVKSVNTANVPIKRILKAASGSTNTENCPSFPSLPAPCEPCSLCRASPGSPHQTLQCQTEQPSSQSQWEHSHSRDPTRT